MPKCNSPWLVRTVRGLSGGVSVGCSGWLIGRSDGDFHNPMRNDPMSAVGLKVRIFEGTRHWMI
jgi:hypothetical protein